MRTFGTNYKIGTSDPIIKHDLGAGIWSSKKRTIKMITLKQEILKKLPVAYMLIGDDAVKHMFYYFSNRGGEYEIDLQGMVNEVPMAKDIYNNELDRVKIFVKKLPIGTHNITTDTFIGGYNNEHENKNWHFAVGGYSAWIKGVAKVEDGDRRAPRKYRLDYEYKIADRYNWDGGIGVGKKVVIYGITITDKFMGEFHRQGLAKEFNMRGSIKGVL
jgi:hypothetical protein